MTENTLEHSDDIALLIWGAFRHPDDKVRTSLRRTHDQWIESCGPIHGREEVREALLKQNGTFLEPYSFPEDVLDETVSLSQIAFSRAYGAKRIHVGTAAPSLPASGMLLTAGLQSTCIERYALGSLRRPPSTAWRINPMHFPSPCGKIPGFSSQAVIVFGKEGLEIRFSWPGQVPDPFGFSYKLTRNSRFCGSGRPLMDSGLRIYNHLRRGRFAIRISSPESMIRMMGMIEERAELLLDAGDESQHSLRVTLGPAHESAPYTRLPTRIHTRGGGLRWIRALQSPSQGPAPAIRTEDRAELARIFPHPLAWREKIDPLLEKS